MNNIPISLNIIHPPKENNQPTKQQPKLPFQSKTSHQTFLSKNIQIYPPNNKQPKQNKESQDPFFLEISNTSGCLKYLIANLILFQQKQKEKEKYANFDFKTTIIRKRTKCYSYWIPYLDNPTKSIVEVMKELNSLYGESTKKIVGKYFSNQQFKEIDDYLDEICSKLKSNDKNSSKEPIFAIELDDNLINEFFEKLKTFLKTNFETFSKEVVQTFLNFKNETKGKKSVNWEVRNNILELNGEFNMENIEKVIINGFEFENSESKPINKNKLSAEEPP